MQFHVMSSKLYCYIQLWVSVHKSHIDLLSDQCFCWKTGFSIHLIMTLKGFKLRQETLTGMCSCGVHVHTGVNPSFQNLLLDHWYEWYHPPCLSPQFIKFGPAYVLIRFFYWNYKVFIVKVWTLSQNYSLCKIHVNLSPLQCLFCWFKRSRRFTDQSIFSHQIFVQ